MHVNPAFFPMVELMPHACVPGTEDGTYLESWTANWSSRAALRSLRLKSRRKHLFLSQPKNNRWWYRFVFDELVAIHTPGEYWAHYFWRAAGGDLAQFAPQNSKGRRMTGVTPGCPSHPIF